MGRKWVALEQVHSHNGPFVLWTLKRITLPVDGDFFEAAMNTKNYRFSSSLTIRSTEYLTFLLFAPCPDTRRSSSIGGIQVHSFNCRCILPSLIVGVQLKTLYLASPGYQRRHGWKYMLAENLQGLEYCHRLKAWRPRCHHVFQFNGFIYWSFY